MSDAKKGTFEFALRSHRVDSSVLEEKHGDVLGMIEILLGKVSIILCTTAAVIVVRGMLYI